MNNTCAIILAAGEGTRMKSDRPKVLSDVLFKPMLQWVIDAVKKSGIDKICVVTGFKHELIDEYFEKNSMDVFSVVQKERKGTAHAVMMSQEFLRQNSKSDVIILGGDSPFIDSKTILESYKLHKSENNSATVVSANIDDPFGYGRIVRDSVGGNLVEIIEQKDASDEVQKINEVNSGAYWFNVQALMSVLNEIKNENAQGEYYLPDALKLIKLKNLKINAFKTGTCDVVLGANDCNQLNVLNGIARRKALSEIMKSGVNVPCTDGVIIGDNVCFGRGVSILPGTIIKGNTSIGSNCIVGPNSFIADSKIGNNVTLNSVYCSGISVKDNEFIRPFTVLSNQSINK